jgi:hypothetical protein
MRPFLKLLTFSLIFSPLSLYASALAATDRDAKSAYDQSMKIYKRDGMTGLVINSQNCHAKSKNKIKCVYLDIIGLRLDMAIVEPMGMPRHPYFETDAVLERTDAVLKAAGVSKNDRPELFGKILEKVRNYL